MKLFILLSALSVLALVATKPVELEEVSRTNDDHLWISGSISFHSTATFEWSLGEMFVITRFELTYVGGSATVTHVSGGIGYKYVKLLIFQPPFATTPYAYTYKIWGTPVNPSNKEYEIIAESDVAIDMQLVKP